MLIRPEAKEEFSQIYQLVKTAFETAEHSDGDEQDFVDQLRAGENYIPELALVAEAAIAHGLQQDGKLIGHIMLTKIYVNNDQAKTGDNQFPALLLAPLAVLLEHRAKGVGSALVNEALARAKNMGYTAVFLVGDPAYYGRFGFKQTSTHGISAGMDFPEQYTLVRELVPGALSGVSGTVKLV